MNDPLKPLASLLLAPIQQPWLDSLNPTMSHFGAMAKDHGTLFTEAIPEEGIGCLGEVITAALEAFGASDDIEASVVLSYKTAITTVSTSVVIPINMILPLLDELEEAEESFRLERLFSDQPNEYNEPPGGVSFNDVDPSVATPLKD